MRISDWSSDVCSSDLGHIRWDVDGLLHERRARAVGDQLRRLAGVIEAEASAVGAVRVEFDRSVTSEQDIRRALAELGVWQRAPLVVPASAASEEEERSEEHTSELQSLLRTSYAVFCLQKKTIK